MSDLDPECEHCRSRLVALERAVASHEARITTHDAQVVMHTADIASLNRKLDSLTESNGRIEKVLERILELITERRP